VDALFPNLIAIGILLFSENIAYRALCYLPTVWRQWSYQLLRRGLLLSDWFMPVLSL